MTNPYEGAGKVFENWKLVSIMKNGEEATEGNRGKVGTLYAVGRDNYGLTETDGAIVYMEGVWGNAPYDIVYKKGNPRDSKGASHADEVEGSVASQKGKMTESVRLRTNEEGFSLEGFEFVGWSLDENGMGDIYRESLDAEGNRIGAEVPSLNEGEHSIITLYAIWEEISYTIHFSSGLADVADSVMAEISDVHYFDVDTETDRLPRNEYVSAGRVFSRWRITNIQGGSRVDTKNIDRELKGTSVKGKLTTSNGAVVTLTTKWILVEEAHTHKACGVANGVECLHDGTRHENDTTAYEIWDDVEDATMEVMRESGGYYYLVDSLDVNREIEVGSGITLHICLNGRKMTGARFTGRGEVYITNCVTDESLNEASIVEEGAGREINIFNGVFNNALK